MKRIRTPEQIAAEIDKLKAEARTAERRRAAALKRIVADLRTHDLSLADVRAALGQKPAAAPRERARQAAKRTAVRYRDREGHTWSGRGRPPRWLTEAEAGGASRESFAVRK